MTDTRRILIVEDEKPMAHALEMKLNNEGFAVEVSENGEEAIKKIEETSYDLVFLDLIMPNADGFEVLKKIKPKERKAKVVVLTNLSQDEDKEKATELGASDYIVKSHTPISEIVEYAKELLHG